MIPKKIHYCWLSGKKMSPNTQKCMKTWKKIMPDYELVLWDTNKFDVESVPFVSQAFRKKKWAFAADYIRLYAVYTEGGIYLDTDVYVIKSFDNLLGYNYFTSLERDLSTVAPESAWTKALKEHENPGLINRTLKRIEGFGIQAAIFGAHRGNALVKDCMEWYEHNNYLLEDGRPLESTRLIAPDIYAAIAQKYGFRYICGYQELKDNMVILPASYFPNEWYKTDNAYAVHLCENSWSEGWFKRSIRKIKENNILRFCFGKSRYYGWEEAIRVGGKYKLQ
jgi:hypothetical protein